MRRSSERAFPMKYLTAVTTALVVLLAGTTGLIGREPAATAPADRVKVAEGINRFAFDLYAKLKDQEGNLFLSPYSISTALTMTYAGARGQTAQQMAEVLHFPANLVDDPDRLHGAYAASIKELNAGGKERGYELAVANRLWGQKGYGFLPDFLGLLKTHYGAGLEEVDFARATEAARQTINGWVEEQTKDKIKELLKPGVLDTMTRLVLTNAIYFKGQWLREFPKDATRDEDFFLAPEKKVTAPMMNQTGEFGYFGGPDFQALELPYKGEDLSMVVLLPKAKDGLADLEKALSAEKVAEAVAKLRKQKVMVVLPKFKTTAEFEQLKEPLIALGMKDAFGTDADFSGMNGKKDLFISAVVHKAFVAVDEEGTEAAAATAVVVKLTALREPPPIFRADHPFVFLIRDKRSGAVLFLGRLTDPTR